MTPLNLKKLTKLNWLKNKKQTGYGNNTPDISQAAMQVLWWESCTTAVPSLWESVCQMWKNGPLQEGMQE